MDDEQSDDEIEISDSSDDDDDSEVEDETETGDENAWKEASQTRSGSTVNALSRLIKTNAVVGFTRQEAVGKLQISNFESNYYAVLMNLSCVETDKCEMEEVDKVHLQE